MSESEATDLLDKLLSMGQVELVTELLDQRNNARYSEHQRKTAENQLEMSANYKDLLRRRADLAIAVLDHTSENALSPEQLDDIAAVVWSGTDVSQTPSANLCARHSVENCQACCGVVDISKPTGLKSSICTPELVIASTLIWNAHWFFKAIEDMQIQAKGGLNLGDLARQIEQWRERVNAWRHVSGVEQHETEEMRSMPA